MVPLFFGQEEEAKADRVISNSKCRGQRGAVGHRLQVERFILSSLLAPLHPTPHFRQSPRELGGKQRVGADRRELREERLIVRHEPGREHCTDMSKMSKDRLCDTAL